MPQKAVHGPWAELQPSQQFAFKFINASSSGGGEGGGGEGEGGGGEGGGGNGGGGEGGGGEGAS